MTSFEETFRQKAKDEIKNINNKTYAEKMLVVKNIYNNCDLLKYKLFNKSYYYTIPKYRIDPVPKPKVYRSYY